MTILKNIFREYLLPCNAIQAGIHALMKSAIYIFSLFILAAEKKLTSVKFACHFIDGSPSNTQNTTPNTTSWSITSLSFYYQPTLFNSTPWMSPNLCTTCSSLFFGMPKSTVQNRLISCPVTVQLYCFKMVITSFRW